MAWDDVVIGKPEPGMNRYTSAHICSIADAPDSPNVMGYRGTGHGISRGRDHFWLSDMILGLDVTIYRGCTEFDRLAKMLDNGKSLNVIMAWLDIAILNHTSAGLIRRRIIDLGIQKHAEGKAAAKAELRNWMKGGNF